MSFEVQKGACTKRARQPSILEFRQYPRPQSEYLRAACRRIMDFYFFTDAALYFFGVEPACLAESNPRAASQ